MYNPHNIKIIKSMLAVYNTEILFLETVEVDAVEWLVILLRIHFNAKEFFFLPHTS